MVGGDGEGINFSNELAHGRGGLPFRSNDPELEKMKYLDQKAGQRCMERHCCGKCKRNSNGTGVAYYEDICMNSVNQSIGRAIRHKVIKLQLSC